MAETSGQSSTTDGKDHTSQVAKHYNELQEAGLAERTKSRIFYLRNFNNWIKSMAIAEFLSKLRSDVGPNTHIRVLDLCSGKGGDLLKWKKGSIDSLVCADIAGTSVEQCEARYNELLERGKKERHPTKTFSAQFITADCTKKRLKDLYKISNNTPEKFDLVSCQFSFHYCFESLDQAHMMIRNASECLEVGGYFIGTTPNSFELVKRLRASDDMSFGNDVYRVRFKTESKKDIPLFGAQYDFHLEGVVDCPEFVVYFPLLEKLAAQYGMELHRVVPFDQYFSEQVEGGRGLIGRMQALEPYPPDKDVELMGSESSDYRVVQERLAQAETDNTGGERRGKPAKYGTLSQAEWEATTIYLLFAFKKVKDVTPPLRAAHQSNFAATPPRDEPTPAQSEDTDKQAATTESAKRPLSDDETNTPEKKIKT